MQDLLSIDDAPVVGHQVDRGRRDDAIRVANNCKAQLVRAAATLMPTTSLLKQVLRVASKIGQESTKPRVLELQNGLEEIHRARRPAITRANPGSLQCALDASRGGDPRARDAQRPDDPSYEAHVAVRLTSFTLSREPRWEGLDLAVALIAARRLLRVVGQLTKFRRRSS